MVIVSDPLYVGDLDDDLHRLLESDSRDKQDIVEAALWEHFGGRKASALESKLQHKRDQLAAVEKEIQSEQADRDRIQREIEQIEARLDSLEDAGDHYEDDLGTVLDELEEGERNRVIPALVEDIADSHGKTAKTVWEDTRDMAVRQQRPLSAQRFVSPMDEPNTPDRPVSDVWGDGE